MEEYIENYSPTAMFRGTSWMKMNELLNQYFV